MSHKEVRSIVALSGAGAVNGVLTAEAPVTDSWEDCFQVEVRLEGWLPVRGRGCDFMAALDEVRLILESEEVLLRVYGASRNVFASGFARSQADGLKAHIIPGMGVHPHRIVDTFDTGPEVVPCTVAEHKAYVQAYVRSVLG